MEEEDPDAFYERFRDRQAEIGEAVSRSSAKDTAPSKEAEEGAVSGSVGVESGEGQAKADLPCTCCNPPVLF